MAPDIVPSASQPADGTGGGQAAAAPAAGVDTEIGSEDSLVMSSESPPTRREPHRDQRSLSTRTARSSLRSPSAGQFSSPPGSKSPTRRGAAAALTKLFDKGSAPGKFRSASAPRSKLRPPSLPRAPLRDPQVVPGPVPAAGEPQPAPSVEHRLNQLEAQQRLDHEFLKEMAGAMRGLNESNDRHRQGMFILENKQQEITAMDLQLRQAMAAAKGKAENDILEAARVTSVAVDAKFDEMKSTLDRMRNEMQGMINRENKVADYLNELKGERPQEGQVVLGFFQHFEGEIANIKQHLENERVNAKQDKPVGDAMAPGAVVFTEHMRVGMTKMHDHTALMDKSLAAMTGNISEIQQRIIGMETQALQYGERIAALAASQVPELPRGSETRRAPSLNLTAAFAGGGCSDSACADTACGSGGNPFAIPQPPGVPAVQRGGQDGGGGDGGALLRVVIGGNGICHCEHVRELQEKVERMEQAGRAAAGDPRGPDRLADAWNLYNPPTRLPPGDAPRPGNGPRDAPQAKFRTLPLPLRGPLGAISFKERSLFDDKMAGQSEFKFDGVKGGIAWKGRIERMFIARAPVLKEILEWAEGEELLTVTTEKFIEAVGSKLTEEQVLTTNAALWGFLSACVSGTAETIFKNGETLNGLDAWRRITRYIEHGRSMRLENLRADVNQMRQRQIKGLEKVEEGIAEFETLLRDYHEVGGTRIEDAEKKSDLLAVLPVEIREHLLWHATDSKRSFDEFRDLVLTQINKILHTRRKLPTHGIVDHESNEDGNDQDIIPFDQPINSLEDLIAAINGRFQNRGNRFQNRNNRAPPPPKSIADRPPRKCANCGQQHPGPCTKTRVPPEQRLCWKCGKPGHISSKCTAAGPVKAVDEGKAEINAVNHCLKAFFMVQDEEGFTQVSKKPAGRQKPQPHVATVADFISENAFDCLQTTSNKRSGARLRVPADEAVAPKPPAVEKIVGSRKANEIAYVKEQDSSSGALRRALLDAQRLADAAIEKAINDPHISHDELSKILDQPGEHDKGINVILDEPDEILAATERVVIKPAMDSGAVDNVINPCDLLSDAEPTPNLTGKHFVGPKGERIDKYGCCETQLEGTHGMVGCKWQLADVTRPLHSVSRVTGPVDGPGKQDVLFTNKRCVVVPPGVVDKIMKSVTPVMEYHREGNLYLAEMTMSAFGRQDQVA